jgi:hypothetical protein
VLIHSVLVHVFDRPKIPLGDGYRWQCFVVVVLRQSEEVDDAYANNFWTSLDTSGHFADFR